MKRDLLFSPGYLLLPALLVGTTLRAQSGPNPAASRNPQSQPVSYASVAQLNGLLGQLEATSKRTQSDLVNLRIEHWKADNSYKRQALSNVDSIQRNLQGALPEIIAQLRTDPENLNATFKLYRNLDALYDVLGSVTEGAGAFGSKDDLQSLSTDLSSFEGTRKQLAERIDNLSSAKEAEIARLRADLKTAQAEATPTPPKKVVVDDTETDKKPAIKAIKKKTPPKKPATDSSKPATGQQSQPQQSQPPPQNSSKPQ